MEFRQRCLGLVLSFTRRRLTGNENSGQVIVRTFADRLSHVRLWCCGRLLHRQVECKRI